MRVNQRGVPIAEEHLLAFPGDDDLSPAEQQEALRLLLAHLRLELWRTNATSYPCDFELQLRPGI